MEEKNNTTVDMPGNDGEFMLEPVPMSARRSTRSQFMVWIGFGQMHIFFPKMKLCFFTAKEKDYPDCGNRL